MKKFLTKKPVMITFLAVAVAFLALYIYMVARPVSFGMGYKYTEDGETSVIVFNNGKELTVKEDDESELKYIEYKGYISIVSSSLTDEQLKEVKKEAKEQFDDFKEYADAKINAFKMSIDYGGSEPTVYTCTGAIVFAVIGGIIEVALLGFGGVSTYFFIKSKKKA